VWAYVPTLTTEVGSEEVADTVAACNSYSFKGTVSSLDIHGSEYAIVTKQHVKFKSLL
jgi:hypothetical protein